MRHGPAQDEDHDDVEAYSTMQKRERIKMGIDLAMPKHNIT